MNPIRLSKLTIALSMTFIGVGASTAATAETLNIAMYGGLGGAALQECAVEPFKKETGITVNVDPGTSAVTLTKLMQQGETSSIDLAWMDGGASEQAVVRGLLETFDESKIPNLKNLHEKGRHQYKNETYAISTGFYALALVYNENEVEEAPTSWKDLWDPAYQHFNAIPSPQNAMGLPFYIFISELFGGDSTDLTMAGEKIKKLESVANWDSVGSANNLFQSEEIGIGPLLSNNAWTLIKDGVPLKVVIPKEGVIANDTRAHLVKGAKNRDLAIKFLDTLLTPSFAQCMASALSSGPAVKGTELSDDVAETMPWGKDGNIDSLVLPDWFSINENREALVESWNVNVS